VNPSCGCTVAKWDKKPIAPGKSVSIDVVFDSKGKIGLQHKTIVVESNAKPESKILSLACEVVLPNNSKIE
jgi:methionine aminopeptidase